MHALLAIAAAHMGKLDVARRHYGMATGQFNLVDDKVISQRADAVFCYCELMTLLTFALECSNSNSAEDPVAGVCQLFKMTRAAVSMLASFTNDLRAPHASRLLRHLCSDTTRLPVQGKIECALTRLDDLVTKTALSSNPEVEAVLHDATLRLRRVYSAAEAHASTWIDIMTWPLEVSQLFLDYLSEGDQAALSVFCFWCASAHHVPRKWFVGDWPKRTILLASVKLQGTQWYAAIEWCLREVELEL